MFGLLCCKGDLSQFDTHTPVCRSVEPKGYPTIYPSEGGVITSLSGLVGQGSDTMDMLTVALKIKVDPSKNVKVSFIAIFLKHLC